jgi:hypothetical protein
MVTSNPNARWDHIPVGRYGSPEEVAEVADACQERVHEWTGDQRQRRLVHEFTIG